MKDFIETTDRDNLRNFIIEKCKNEDYSRVEDENIKGWIIRKETDIEKWFEKKDFLFIFIKIFLLKKQNKEINIKFKINDIQVEIEKKNYENVKKYIKNINKLEVLVENSNKISNNIYLSRDDYDNIRKDLFIKPLIDLTKLDKYDDVSPEQEDLIKHIKVDEYGMGEEQEIEGVKIKNEYPISSINFKKKDAIKALLLAKIKTQNQGCTSDFFCCYLNNKNIIKIDMKKIKEYENFLKEENEIKIRHLKKDSWEYFKLINFSVR